MFGVNQGCRKQNLNESVLNRNVYLNSSNANEKTVIARQKSLHDPLFISVYMLTKWFIMNQASLVSDQVSNKSIDTSSNNCMLLSCHVRVSE